MVIVFTIEVFNVQAHAAIARQRLKELFEQLCVHIADLVALEIHFPDKIRSLAEIDGGAAERLIHWQLGMAIARDACKITKRFLDRLTDYNARIFNRMVSINVKVALRFHRKINEGMAPARIQHMIEETNTGGDIRHSRAIEVYGHFDVGFFRFARNCGGSVGHAGPNKV